jgi:uncharacterized membrane protein YkvA (DUF1232 family)
MSDASDKAFDPMSVIPRERALTPAVTRVNERRVARGFWPKLKRVARHIPFAPEAVSLWYCAADPETPASAKALVMAGLAYFVLPTDVIPDFIAVIGYTDDAAVIATVLALVGRHVKPRHRDAAKAFLDRLARDA